MGTVAYQRAKEIIPLFLKNEIDITPALIITTRDDKIIHVPLDYIPDYKWRDVIERLLSRFKATSYVFFAESFQSNISSDSPIHAKLLTGEMKVSELPPDDRLDTVNIFEIKDGNIPNACSSVIHISKDGERTLAGFQDMGDILINSKLPLTW